MTVAWTQEQDDQAAFDEAMETADVSVRRIESQLGKLQQKIDALHHAPTEKARETFHAHALNIIAGISRTIQTPAVNQWRQEHNEGRGRRHSQQHILEVKLALARDLLAERGVDFDKELATRRLGS